MASATNKSYKSVPTNSLQSVSGDGLKVRRRLRPLSIFSTCRNRGGTETDMRCFWIITWKIPPSLWDKSLNLQGYTPWSSSLLHLSVVYTPRQKVCMAIELMTIASQKNLKWNPKEWSLGRGRSNKIVCPTLKARPFTGTSSLPQFELLGPARYPQIGTARHALEELQEVAQAELYRCRLLQGDPGNRWGTAAAKLRRLAPAQIFERLKHRTFSKTRSSEVGLMSGCD